MDKSALKEIVYGSLRELLTNSKYIYNSCVGPEYSEWTEAGQKEVLSYLKHVSFLIVQSEHKDLDNRAKQMVLENLKTNGS